MSTDLFHIIHDIENVIIPTDGLVTRTVFEDDSLKAVLFGFAPGKLLAEHTTPMPAVMHFIRGDSTITLGQHQEDAHAGTWVHMKPNLPHSILAVTETVMLLLLVKCGKPASATQGGGTQ